jgi:hypothetical protein
MNIGGEEEEYDTAGESSNGEPTNSFSNHLDLSAADDWLNYISVWPDFIFDDTGSQPNRQVLPSTVFSWESNDHHYYDGFCMDPELLEVPESPNTQLNQYYVSDFGPAQPSTPVSPPSPTPALSFGPPTPTSSPALYYGPATPQVGSCQQSLLSPTGSASRAYRHVFCPENLISYANLMTQINWGPSGKEICMQRYIM